MKNRVKFGFVILHYLAFNMTKECVKTILNTFDHTDIEIVIVDNASYNGSGIELEIIFREYSNVKVILNSKNEGFARGNNIGYTYLKENFDCEYMIILNNDVLIEDKNLYQTISDINTRVNFDILGPDIYVPSRNIHQNPVNIKADFDETSLKKKIRQLKLLNACFPVNFRIYCLYWKILKYIRPRKKDQTVLYTTEKTNPLLHGACYIFSKKFIDNHKYPFNPNTFLYFEEDILYYQSMNDRLLLYYSPLIKVKHLEDVATNQQFKTYYQKEKMKTKEQLKSALVFKRLMENK